MKIKKITITGMHKVDKKTYILNDGITYFVGENGAGKSTILEAIQLALLGYIPGYAKTAESIMKHASGPVMCIEAELEDGITITRTWNRAGSSVKSNVDVTGYEGNIKDLLGEIDLPVFDFNEFRSMTSNKLKDWFITFLPKSASELNLRKELSDAMGKRVIPSDYLLDEIDSWAESSGLEGLELIRSLNEKLKADQSFVKGQVAKLQGTLQSLVKYDDAEDIDEDQINKEMDALFDMKATTIQMNTGLELHKKAEAALSELKSQLPGDSFESDPSVPKLKRELEEVTKKSEILKADYNDLQLQIYELEQKKSMLPKAGARCPYTNEECQTAAALANKTREQIEEIDKQIAFKKEELKDCDGNARMELDRKALQINAELGAIQSKYDRLVSLELQFKNTEMPEYNPELTLPEIDAKMKLLQEQLAQVQANKKYDELADKITADKFKLENELEVFKVWIKLTDANGLQTRLMNEPFENLAGDISKYLSQMFNKEVTASFNLSEKANSFSFGLDRNGQYIEFDYLSSGERCLFTLALIMCILDKSDSKVRTILIDDILDHLDSSNADYLFESLKKITDIQFILAGVKECKDDSICFPVK